jgi:hypothetical protein
LSENIFFPGADLVEQFFLGTIYEVDVPKRERPPELSVMSQDIPYDLPTQDLGLVNPECELSLGSLDLVHRQMQAFGVKVAVTRLSRSLWDVACVIEARKRDGHKHHLLNFDARKRDADGAVGELYRGGRIRCPRFGCHAPPLVR